MIDISALRRRLDHATRSDPSKVRRALAEATVPVAPKRVLYLEDRVAQLEEVIAKLDPIAMTDIKERLDAVDQKVTDLVQIWS